MNHFSFELSLLAMIPGLFLCGYVLYKDRIEKEPVSLLALLFGAGAVTYVPAYFLRELTVGFIDGLFADKMKFSVAGVLTYDSSATELWHNALCAFLGFSIIQVCLKWVVLYFGTRRNKNFNYLFDGVVYSVFLSLGFAAAELVHFAMQNEGELVIAKLITCVPCHLFVGILMGYYYTMGHMRFLVNRIENRMLADKVVAEDKIRSSAPWLICSLAVPALVNGLYEFAAASRGEFITILFYSTVFFVFGISFLAVNQLAEKECASARYLCRVIAKGHPGLTAEQIEAYVSSEEGVYGEAEK